MDSSQIGRTVWFWPGDARFGDEATAAIITGTYADGIVDLITFPAGNQPLPVTRVPRNRSDGTPMLGSWQPRTVRRRR